MQELRFFHNDAQGRGSKAKNLPRPNTDFASNFSPIATKRSVSAKFIFRFSEKCACMPASCFHQEGRFGRSPRTWEAGCDGRISGAGERRLMRTSEVVWSRSPDAGIKLCGRFREATVANKPGAPRRSRISRKPSRRECRLFSAHLYDLRAFLATHCTQGLAGAAEHPAFPAPS